ncbi:MAG: 2-amino-4-hydroxy-6-hydroxymethyldihydropteridine diphosphokinase [Bdellovibrionales bacterium RIFOXYB1_FULL_37_110]|nr:MAG: 2-amino-4-hydroxy-6-hydroxymethyldihydropteridine diphosphokinase [Bdellovibrionales bacterium RIFOXYA1_FULL_38_20]OFZ52236.1 MAG: 2-amino-4-hydroxy-6-hydroxymethyldihydropteridine diphosphokinase [Bdellovibrionales bacterium RIFOXYC1_FULL_37_79]OFZ56863.1 MAG: 2-amino-4-hydroxy-6-hydroxymethyldihydropteridine diphosphokinase [Bdellovibrionales bacterium RIFOXYB2_FULL_36_6]OFZ57223.1 MAG: 2-amino-4-hydroxy-6-hydroxymethyldihydropteridine diphosphokinase [Bdellovibrionales bacterium RIFOX
MSLVIGIGSNIGNRMENLRKARALLENHFELIAESRIYKSEAEDYENQPYFYNQVLEFVSPDIDEEILMKLLLSLEDEMGRERIINKGPRIIDMDLLFFGDRKVKNEIVEIPHPRLFDRSFVVKPLSDLPCFEDLNRLYQFKKTFANLATPV